MKLTIYNIQYVIKHYANRSVRPFSGFNVHGGLGIVHYWFTYYGIKNVRNGMHKFLPIPSFYIKRFCGRWHIKFEWLNFYLMIDWKSNQCLNVMRYGKHKLRSYSYTDTTEKKYCIECGEAFICQR